VVEVVRRRRLKDDASADLRQIDDCLERVRHMKHVLDRPAVEDDIVLPGRVLGDNAAIEIQQVGAALVIAVVETVQRLEAERGEQVGVVALRWQCRLWRQPETAHLTCRLRPGRVHLLPTESGDLAGEGAPSRFLG
jgi:hypothetical protein